LGLTWALGNSGINGNELAKLGSECLLTGPDMKAVKDLIETNRQKGLSVRRTKTKQELDTIGAYVTVRL
jgi:hypothetical protein